VPATSQTSGNRACCFPGDVYITRHSNLTGGSGGGLAGGGGGISLVFHLVVDEAAEGEGDRLRQSSRLHAALSAVLRTCFHYDVTTLTLPLLMVRSLSPVSKIIYTSVLFPNAPA
ncbi:unnamed protein product, partial [Protopolystoma xenopodis]